MKLCAIIHASNGLVGCVNAFSISASVLDPGFVSHDSGSLVVILGTYTRDRN